MCGINGYIDKSRLKDLNPIISRMNDLIFHRGPDDGGFLIEENIAIGMRRLSIIDIKNGSQPMRNKAKNISLVFNGEIYNYKNLKDKLIIQGISFKTKSDTEVIIKLYETYGTDSFSMLDGMFSFSLLDLIKKKVFIVRDFFGEKPLYYCQNNISIIWASELKSIISVLENKPSINKNSLNLYFRLTYVPAPYTIFDGIEKLEPNHYLSIDIISNQIEKKAIEHNFKSYNFKNKNEIKNTIQESVFDSVRSRSVSDVPLSTFLSGGVDSSIVSYCLAKNSNSKIDTFSIGFENKSFDESDKAKMVSDLIGSNHHSIICSEKSIIDNVEEVLLNFDEPFADSSALASYLVSKSTSKYFKVALTGDGADEVFGGYNKYLSGKITTKYTNLVPQVIHYKIKRIYNKLFSLTSDQRGLKYQIKKYLNAIDYNGKTYLNLISLGFDQSTLSKILSDDFLNTEEWSYYKTKIPNNPKSLNDFKKIDSIFSLDGDLLTKVDRTSMLSSIECRAPFLNKELWNLTLQLKEKYLIKGLDKKHILKESFREFFPDKFLDFPKKGFGVPVGDWLRTVFKNELLYYSSKKIIETQKIFNYLYINKLINLHIGRKCDYSFQLWTFFCFQKWYLDFYGSK